MKYCVQWWMYTYKYKLLNGMVEEHNLLVGETLKSITFVDISWEMQNICNNNFLFILFRFIKVLACAGKNIKTFPIYCFFYIFRMLILPKPYQWRNKCVREWHSGWVLLYQGLHTDGRVCFGVSCFHDNKSDSSFLW